MKFYTFGHQNNPVLLLLPGTCCHWKRNFGPGRRIVRPAAGKTDFRRAPWHVPKGQAAGVDAETAGKESAGRTGVYGTDDGDVWNRLHRYGVCPEEKHLQPILFRPGDTVRGRHFCPRHRGVYLLCRKDGRTV